MSWRDQRQWRVRTKAAAKRRCSHPTSCKASANHFPACENSQCRGVPDTELSEGSHPTALSKTRIRLDSLLFNLKINCESAILLDVIDAWKCWTFQNVPSAAAKQAVVWGQCDSITQQLEVWTPPALCVKFVVLPVFGKISHRVPLTTEKHCTA